MRNRARTRSPVSGPNRPLAQALALMRAHAVKRRSWLGLLHGELAFWVGRIDGWFAFVARSERFSHRSRLCAYPTLIREVFSATERRNHPSIPLAAGAAFRRRGPSLGRRVSARKSLGHSPPGPVPAASGRSGTARSCDQASLAPVRTRPVSENRQSAMSSLRASATIITRRIRPRDPAVRSLNHLLSALSG